MKFGLIWLFVILACSLTFSKLIGNEQITWLSIILLITIPISIGILGIVIIDKKEKKEEEELEKTPNRIRMQQVKKRLEEHEIKSEEFLQRNHDNVKKMKEKYKKLQHLL